MLDGGLAGFVVLDVESHDAQQVEELSAFCPGGLSGLGQASWVRVQLRVLTSSHAIFD